MITRRSLLRGSFALPAIIAVDRLMKVKKSGIVFGGYRRDEMVVTLVPSPYRARFIRLNFVATRTGVSFAEVIESYDSMVVDVL